MRWFSACRGLLSTATVIGAALFSVTASATTIVPIAPYRSGDFLIVSVLVSGNAPTGFVQFYGSYTSPPISWTVWWRDGTRGHWAGWYCSSRWRR